MHKKNKKRNEITNSDYEHKLVEQNQKRNIMCQPSKSFKFYFCFRFGFELFCICSYFVSSKSLPITAVKLSEKVKKQTPKKKKKKSQRFFVYILNLKCF